MSLQTRLEARIVMQEGCWLWNGAHSDRGYPQLYVDGKSRRVARLLWTFENGPIPKGLYVCHRCDNPCCVNPDHFFLGTQSDNMKDSVLKGRHMNTKKTHYRHGHKYTPENTYVDAYKGWSRRICRKCRAKVVRTLYWKKKNPAVQALGKEETN